MVEGIKSLDGLYALTPKHLPSFLYRNGVLVIGDIYKGLFLSELLIRVSHNLSFSQIGSHFGQAGLCILRGQESAMDGKGTKNTGKSVSARHKIKIVTPAFIAYTATLVRSDECNCPITDYMFQGSFHIVESDDMEQFGRQWLEVSFLLQATA